MNQTELLSKYKVNFSGCQILQQSNPFGLIRQYYGDVKVCIVKFWSTTLLIDKIASEYYSLIMRPIFNPDPNKNRVFIPKTEFIDGMSVGWEKDVSNFIKSTNGPKLIIMEGIYSLEENEMHNKRIETILAKLN